MVSVYKILPVIILAVVSFACVSEEESIYTSNMITYDLVPASEYDYQGVAIVREIRDGGVELELLLEGEKSAEPYFYPAHLHRGSYDSDHTPMAQMLSPVDARTLISSTIITQLADGSKMDFNRFLEFDGHIKVHLAEDGPDYDVILVVGNVGANSQ